MRLHSAERTASPSTFQRAHTCCGLTARETGERNQSSSSSSTWFLLAGRARFELMLIVSISRLLQDRLCPTEAYLTTFICRVSLFVYLFVCSQHFSSSNARSQSNKWFPNRTAPEATWYFPAQSPKDKQYYESQGWDFMHSKIQMRNQRGNRIAALS